MRSRITSPVSLDEGRSDVFVDGLRHLPQRSEAYGPGPARTGNHPHHAAGRTHPYRVDAPWAGSRREYRCSALARVSLADRLAGLLPPLALRSRYAQRGGLVFGWAGSDLRHVGLYPHSLPQADRPFRAESSRGVFGRAVHSGTHTFRRLWICSRRRHRGCDVGRRVPQALTTGGSPRTGTLAGRSEAVASANGHRQRESPGYRCDRVRAHLHRDVRRALESSRPRRPARGSEHRLRRPLALHRHQTVAIRSSRNEPRPIGDRLPGGGAGEGSSLRKRAGRGIPSAGCDRSEPRVQLYLSLPGGDEPWREHPVPHLDRHRPGARGGRRCPRLHTRTTQVTSFAWLQPARSEAVGSMFTRTPALW